MKQYPSIPKDINFNITVTVQPKFDGSNIRAEWNPKKGFYKFGSRHVLIDNKHETLGSSIDLILSTYGDSLNQEFSKLKYQSAVAFFEYFGPNSMFGRHVNEPHEVMLLDVNPFKIGILCVDEFYKLFGHLKVPEILFKDKLNNHIVEQIKNNQLNGQAFEGVICKGKENKLPVSFKIKTYDWLNKLKEYCAGDEELFKKLL